MQVFQIQIGEPLYLINNSPPVLRDLDPILISPGDHYTYYTHVVDVENNAVHVDSWSPSVNYDWVHFTNSSAIEECKFEFLPPIN